MPNQDLKFWTVALVATVFFLGCSGPLVSPGPDDALSLPPPHAISPPGYMYSDGKAHFRARVIEIDAQPILSGGILLAGDSITEGWLGQDIDFGVPISNHGVGWDTVTGLKSRLPQMLRHSPDKVFILIGTNDIGYGRGANVITSELSAIIEAFQKTKPETEIFIQGVMPRNIDAMPRVDEINENYRRLAQERNVTYVDLQPVFAAADGTLKPELTYDGLHLNEAGYERWAKAIRTYIEN